MFSFSFRSFWVTYLILVVISEREEEEEGNESVENIFQELALDAEMFPAEAMEGEWV